MVAVAMLKVAAVMAIIAVVALILISIARSK